MKRTDFFIRSIRDPNVAKMNGCHPEVRKQISKDRTGNCSICTINLYKNGRPAGSTMPCPIDICPFTETKSFQEIKSLGETFTTYVFKNSESWEKGNKKNG
tara:strand:- start:3646 stop:3948 length:303 start_codon:yes stop_codon:yes gene_type:complete